MEIIEIKEPDSKDEIKSKRAVGIDFGTTNSLIAYISGGTPKILSQTSSVIAKDGSIGIGDFRSIKRLIGKSYEDIQNAEEVSEIVKKSVINEEGQVKLPINGKNLTISESASLIISYLKQEAEREIGPIDSAVITVPAHFDDVMRSCIKDAANKSGLEVLRLISEPTAAAYAYCLEEEAEGKYAVYDLGGGTFDISLLRMKMGVFQVIATDGNNMLGGDDIDHRIAKHFDSDLSKDLLSKQAKIAKEHLAKNDSWENKDLGLSLSIEEFEKVAGQVIAPSIEMTKNIIKDHEIKGIILVGGSTKMRLVSKLLSDLAPKIYNNIDPDESVAVGAAYQAHNLTSGSKDLIIDVVPLSLGMEIMGGIMEKVILRNSPLPISTSQEFTTSQDNQTEIQINIYQGEREMIKDCRSLGKFALSNIPPMKAGMPRIEVTFNIDADGLLTVSATEKVTGIAQRIEVKPSYGISNEDVENIVEESYKHAREDHEERLLAESIISANREIDSLEKAFIETPNIVSEEEKEDIESRIEKLKLLIPSKDRGAITDATNELKEESENFTEERMNFILNESLRGKRV